MRAAQRVRIGNRRGPPAFAPVIWFGALEVLPHIGVVPVANNKTQRKNTPEDRSSRLPVIKAQPQHEAQPHYRHLDRNPTELPPYQFPPSLISSTVFSIHRNTFRIFRTVAELSD